MKKIYLTGKKANGKSTMVDDRDYSILSNFCWSIDAFGYAYHTFCKNGKNKNVRMHTFLLNPPKGLEVDHKDRNTLNNKRNNLRIVTRSINSYNHGLQSNNTSGHKGIVRHQSGWMVRLGRKYIGLFLDIKDAVKARKIAELQLEEIIKL